jgi:plastocyanin
MGHTRRTGAVTLVTVATALTLAACGGASTGGNGEAATSKSSAATGKGVPVNVVETEFSISVPASLPAGTYAFTVRNQGTMPHNLTVKGPGVAQASPTQPPGQSTVLTLTLQKGSYELWCSVDNHKALGMDRTLNVK